MSSIYSKAERYKYFIKLLMDKYKPRCYFCNKELDSTVFYRNISGLSKDDLTWHHIDENRNNNHIDNLVISHRKCHLAHHRQKETIQALEEYRRGV